MHGRGLTAVIGASFLLGLTEGSLARAQRDVTEDQKIVVADAAEGGVLGYGVSASGDRMVAGMAGLDRAVVYRRSAGRWIEEQVLAPFDGFDANFGVRVAMQDDLIVVGSTARGTRRGGAYVFRRVGETWETVSLLLPSDSAPWDDFGSDVAVDGEVIAVGRIRTWTDDGAVYVFRFDGGRWREEQIIDEIATFQGGFGRAIAVDGDRMIIGEPTFDDEADRSSAGRALVYQFDGRTWQLEQDLRASEPQAHDTFGSSVDVQGDLAVVGALSRRHRGVAVIFRRHDSGVWQEVTEIVHPYLLTFGAGVEFDGGRLLVGARGAAQRVGGAALYRDTGSGWVEQATLRPSDGLAPDRFGWQTALSGSQVIVASPFADAHAEDVGALYAREFAELSLIADPADPATGDPIKLATRGALPASPGMLFLVELDGLPFVQGLFVGTASSEGLWTVRGTVPPGLSGHDLGFLAVGYPQPEVVGASRVTVLHFQ